MSKRIRPFSQGTQYLDWNCANCCTCARYNVKDGEVVEPVCELEEALSLACVLDGTIEPEIAVRLGVPSNTWSHWTCKEHQPIREDGSEFHKPASNQMSLPLGKAS